MRIATECPACLAELQIPEELAGKTVKCLECGGHVYVPGGEDDSPEETEQARRRDDEPEDHSRNSSPLPRNKRSRDDDKQDRPRRRKAKSRKKSGNRVGLWITLGIVILVVIVIGTIGTIVLVKKDSPNLVNDVSPDGTNPVDDIGLRVSTSGVNRPALPAGWIDFHHPYSLYWVYVPRKPTPVYSFEINGGQQKAIPTEDEYDSQDMFNRSVPCCDMRVSTFTPEVAQQYKTGKREVSNTYFGPTLTTTKVTWGGEAATEVEVNGTPEFGGPVKRRYYMRWVVFNDRLYQYH